MRRKPLKVPNLSILGVWLNSASYKWNTGNLQQFFYHWVDIESCRYSRKRSFGSQAQHKYSMQNSSHSFDVADGKLPKWWRVLVICIENLVFYWSLYFLLHFRTSKEIRIASKNEHQNCFCLLWIKSLMKIKYSELLL